jgi:predicted thioesterase
MAEYQVGANDTAAGFGSDFPAVASTPFVLGISEVTCHQAAKPLLQAGQITVGIGAKIEHLLPSKVGTTLTVRAVLTKRLGRRLHFRVSVSDGDKTVARIAQWRAITSLDRFRSLLS